MLDPKFYILDPVGESFNGPMDREAASVKAAEMAENCDNEIIILEALASVECVTTKRTKESKYLP